MRSILDNLRTFRRRSTSFDEVQLVYESFGTMNRMSAPSRSLMIDVGAHYGSSFERFLNQGWEVHAFEPDDDNRNKLLNRFGSNDNLTVDDRAVSDKLKDSVSFYRSKKSTGISGLSQFHNSHTKDGTVETVPLSLYIEESEINRVDFLKVDAEGHDLPVLKSFPFGSLKPTFVMCEFGDKKTKNYGYRFEDICEYMINKGYEVIVSEWHPIEEYGNKHRWNTYHNYPCNLQNSDAWGNLIGASCQEAFHALNYNIRIFRLKNVLTRIMNLI